MKIDAIVKKYVYKIIDEIQKKVGSDNNKATENIVKQVFSDFMRKEKMKPDPHEIQNWIDRHSIGGVILYKQTLMDLYGKKIRRNPKRSTQEINKINDLRSKLYGILKERDLTLKEFFAVIDTDNN